MLPSRGREPRWHKHCRASRQRSRLLLRKPAKLSLARLKYHIEKLADHHGSQPSRKAKALFQAMAGNNKNKGGKGGKGGNGNGNKGGKGAGKGKGKAAPLPTGLYYSA